MDHRYNPGNPLKLTRSCSVAVSLCLWMCKTHHMESMSDQTECSENMCEFFLDTHALLIIQTRIKAAAAADCLGLLQTSLHLDFVDFQQKMFSMFFCFFSQNGNKTFFFNVLIINLIWLFVNLSTGYNIQDIPST